MNNIQSELHHLKSSLLITNSDIIQLHAYIKETRAAYNIKYAEEYRAQLRSSNAAKKSLREEILAIEIGISNVYYDVMELNSRGERRSKVEAAWSECDNLLGYAETLTKQLEDVV